MSEVVDVSPKPPIAPVYLGDGVYASFDGYQIWLHLGDHTIPGIIAIEPKTFDSLQLYAQRAWEKNRGGLITGRSVHNVAERRCQNITRSAS